MPDGWIFKGSRLVEGSVDRGPLGVRGHPSYTILNASRCDTSLKRQRRRGGALPRLPSLALRACGDSLAGALGLWRFPRWRFGLVAIPSLTLRACVDFLARASGLCHLTIP